MCKRIVQIRALIKRLLTKYHIFTILPQISHFHKYRNFSSIFATFLDQLLHPYKFYGRDMSGILFFIFASCEPLRLIVQHQTIASVTEMSSKMASTLCYIQVVDHFFCQKAQILYSSDHTICLSFTSMWSKYISNNVWRDFRMSASAMVT